LKLIAYEVTTGMEVQLRPAERNRAWMDATSERFANRCLPLVIANQYGWEVLSSHRVIATWDGGSRVESVRVQHSDGGGTPLAASHFGFGILTFSTPFLFRTQKNWNLLIRGPTNRPKDGIAALDGIVETDWAESTFTINWKFTRPGTVSFEAGEPIGMILPLPRRSLEECDPEIRPVSDNPALEKAFNAWSQSRTQFNADLKVEDSKARDERWQRDYTRGASQTKTLLKPFRKKLPPSVS